MTDQPNGILKELPQRLHHNAYVCEDQERTRQFYEDVIGLPLLATWIEESEFAQFPGKRLTYSHTFYGIGDGGALAFFQFPDPEAAAAFKAQQQPFFVHIAFAVSESAQKEIKRRLAAAGKLLREADHGYCTSIYAQDPDGLIVESRTNLFALPEFTAGDFEAQNEGSQLLAELCGGERELIVDLCAGAGGKTLALAAAMGNRGRVIACDVDDGKLVELRKRARRAGVTTVEPLHLADGTWPDTLERRRDGVRRVLVDAPCSGVGSLRRNPEARWRLTPQDLRELPQKQRAILDDAAALVAPGGRLIYATCTIDRTENDDIVAAFLAAHPEFRPQPAREILGRERTKDICDDDGVCLRLLPGVRPAGLDDALAPDGFFAVVLRRAE